MMDIYNRLNSLVINRMENSVVYCGYKRACKRLHFGYAERVLYRLDARMYNRMYYRIEGVRWQKK